MEASSDSLPQSGPRVQPLPLRVGDAVRARGDHGRSDRETGVVRQAGASGLLLVYWQASGHRVWHKPEALVATGERVAPKAGPR